MSWAPQVQTGNNQKWYDNSLRFVTREEAEVSAKDLMESSMPYYDSFDICEAHCVLEWDYNRDGWLRERPSNQRRMESTSTQLRRMGFRSDWSLCYGTLTENGKAIYDALLVRYGLYKLDEE